MKVALIVMGMVIAAFSRAAVPAVPPVEGTAFLGSWKEGVRAADASEDPLVVVCFGDSNTEMGSYVSALREALQGCYGERGYGYHTFGKRTPVSDAPTLEKTGRWTDRHVGPEIPPTPWFAPDLLWTETDDPEAAVSVSFGLGSWGTAGDSLARAYDGRSRFRIHYRTGPGLGSFGIYSGEGELARIDTAAGEPGYGLSEPFQGDGFRIAGIRGSVVLLGYDAVRAPFLKGKPVLRGGALVHALGRSWGQAAHFSRIESNAFGRCLAALEPDLITILLGTNDMHNEGQPDRFRTNLETLVRKLRQAAPGAGILVIACPEAPQTREGLAVQYRDIARAVAAGNGCAFWSLADLVGERSRDWTREGFFGDGLHYNRLGGSLLARLLLRQLQFDVNDLAHYPALRPAAPPPAERAGASIPRVRGEDGLAGREPFVIWRQDRRAAELWLGLADGALAVRARVYGANPDAGLDLYVSKSETNAIRQVVIRRDRISLHENGKDMPAPAVQARVEPLEPLGFEWRGSVPLAALGLDNGAADFLLEAAAVTAPVAGAKPEFNRLFAGKADRGAFRDSSGSARVTVVE